MTSQQEIQRRYDDVRRQAQEDGLDAVVVAGSEYTGFEGAVRYLSGFRLLHRYAYVVLPVEGEPSVVSPRRRGGLATTARPGSRTRSLPSTPASGSPTAGSERSASTASTT